MKRIITNNRIKFLNLTVCSLFLLAAKLSADIRKLPDGISFGAFNDYGQVVSIYAASYSPLELQINYYDGNNVTSIGSRQYFSPPVSLNNKGQIAWSDGFSVYLYENGNNTLISGPFVYVASVKINDEGTVAWQGDNDIFEYKNGIAQNLTNTPDEVEVFRDMNNQDHIVWANYSTQQGLYLYDGVSAQNINPDGSVPYLARINENDNVTWIAYQGGDSKIMFYDTQTVKELGKADYFSDAFIGGNNQVAWQKDNQIYYYDGQVHQITDSGLNFLSGMNAKGEVTYSTYNGSFPNFETSFFLYDGKVSRDITPSILDQISVVNLDNQGRIYYGSNSSMYVDEPAPVDSQPVPEPSTLMLLGLGLPAAAWFSRRKNRN